MKVENTRLIRGSLLAAASRPFIVWPSATDSCPSSASIWYSKPPVVDRPMIGGRLKGNTVAERTCCTAPKTWRINACARWLAAVRSSNGFSLRNMNAALLSCALSSSEKPMMENRCPARRACPLVRASTRRTTLLVRATDAPSGNWITTKKPPWSSSGRKPVGVRRDNPKIPAPNTS